jgi:hypothetical protein
MDGSVRIRPAALLVACMLVGIVLSACGRRSHTTESSGNSKPVRAAKVCPPRPPEAVDETSKIVPEWESKLVYCAYGPEESDAIAIDVYVVKAGDAPVRLAQGLVGDFIPLVKARRVFACEYNSVMDAKRPLLFDLQGTQTLLPEHPGYLRTCAAVGSGEQVLVQYDQIRDADQLFATARVFGSSGQLLVEREFLDDGVLEFSDAGQTYTVPVPAPEYPD